MCSAAASHVARSQQCPRGHGFIFPRPVDVQLWSGHRHCSTEGRVQVFGRTGCGIRPANAATHGPPRMGVPLGETRAAFHSTRQSRRRAPGPTARCSLRLRVSHKSRTLEKSPTGPRTQRRPPRPYAESRSSACSTAKPLEKSTTNSGGRRLMRQPRLKAAASGAAAERRKVFEFVEYGTFASRPSKSRCRDFTPAYQTGFPRVPDEVAAGSVAARRVLVRAVVLLSDQLSAIALLVRLPDDAGVGATG